jgi:hypothetical protein
MLTKSNLLVHILVFFLCTFLGNYAFLDILTNYSNNVLAYAQLKSNSIHIPCLPPNICPPIPPSPNNPPNGTNTNNTGNPVCLPPNICPPIPPSPNGAGVKSLLLQQQKDIQTLVQQQKDIQTLVQQQQKLLEQVLRLLG